ncbi:hypothetical protein SEA_HIRKO_63 [Arthrobacter phage Hirko]|nr:hypothetical protein SEA_HIRKO_63 [Arthrobacter phage Hirko]
MSAQPVEQAPVVPLPAPSGRDYLNAINTRRRRKCIAEGAHTTVGVKCERCGL